jgi:hypothetical protein
MPSAVPFPPTPDHPRDIDLLLAAYGCAFPEREPWYLSSPITTGARFESWRSEEYLPRHHPDYSAQHKQMVVEPNLREAITFASKLRGLGHIVIVPAELPDIPGWTQSDYRFAWGEVIRMFVSTAVFMNGWETSSGCCYEFLVAAELGLPILGQDMTEVSLPSGIKLIDQRPRASRENQSFIDRVRSALDRVQSGRDRNGGPNEK